MTKGAISKTWELQPLISYITDRINKDTAQKIAKVENNLITISEATKTITNISISVEWIKTRTWGMCPKAEARICFTDNTCETYQSGRVTGCGFDKESTAIANAINQCNELLRVLYTKKEDSTEKDNRVVFGYGSGYGVRPYFEGGVGVSCYPAIFTSIGYEWEGVSHGKAFDVYAVKQATNKG